MLAFVDLETTGLDPETCAILELGFILTEDDLTEVARYQSVLYRPDISSWAPDPVVLEMHASNGLRRECRDAVTALHPEDAARGVLLWLRYHIPEDGVVPLAGSSVQFDRGFLARKMPRVEELFHYRNVDFSFFKEMAPRWWPEAEFPEGRKIHRSIPDLEDTLAQARYVRDHFGFGTRLRDPLTQGV